MRQLWSVLKTAALAFIQHDALSRGAAIAFFAVTSLTPVLLVVVSIAGLVFGEDAARAGISTQLIGLVGPQGADLIKSALASSRDTASGVTASLIGVATIIIAVSGVFGEMHTALNQVWHGEVRREPVLSLIRTRAASLGLVAALGFLLIVSLAASAALSALGGFVGTAFPLASIVLPALNTLVSIGIFALLFAAIYKVLPDQSIDWHEVLIGASLTALLFTAGESLIGWYLGRAAVGSTYGAAGALIVLMFWLYYSSLIFLFGAEITKAIADSRSARAEADDAVIRTSGQN